MAKGQMKIQQMAFMLVAVFIFFALVGIGFLGYNLKDIRSSAQELERQSTISSLKVIADMPELNCGSGKFMCLDKDKLLVMSSADFLKKYSEFWGVASVEVKKIHSFEERNADCFSSSENCNYYEIYNSNSQTNSQKYSTYVSICEKKSESGIKYDFCELGKLIVGVKSGN